MPTPVSIKSKILINLGFCTCVPKGRGFGPTHEQKKQTKNKKRKEFKLAKQKFED